MLVMLVLGIISMRGAPIALTTHATAQFKRFFDCGRAVRCLLPLGAGRLVLPGGSPVCWLEIFQRGAHQNSLRGKRDFGWALG